MVGCAVKARHKSQGSHRVTLIILAFGCAEVSQVSSVFKVTLMEDAWKHQDVQWRSRKVELSVPVLYIYNC